MHEYRLRAEADPFPTVWWSTELHAGLSDCRTVLQEQLLLLSWGVDQIELSRTLLPHESLAATTAACTRRCADWRRQVQPACRRCTSCSNLSMSIRRHCFHENN